MTKENEQQINKKVDIDMQTARKNGVHIDVAVNPFITEEQRDKILCGEAQDPEWD